MPGRDLLIASTSCSESLFVKDFVPITLSGRSLYYEWELKNLTLFFKATSTGTLFLISYWALFTIPMYPSFKNISSFINIFLVLVPFVHDVNLRNNTDGSLTFRIPLSSQLQTIWNREILICRNNTQYDSFWIAAISFRHLSCNLLDILLSFHVNLVMPGRSIMVRSGQSAENILSLIGSSMIFD